MRNLTITRRKSKIACLMTMKIYIEDNENPEIYIKGLGCSKLGELKNGESGTFSVTNEAVKVFVIADTKSAGVCNDFVNLPAGEEDLCYEGVNKYQPSLGNPFRFDVADEEVLANRKSASKKRNLIRIGSIVAGILIGLFCYRFYIMEMGAEPKDFTYEEMTITLTDLFEKGEDNEAYDVCYESAKMIVSVIREDFDLMLGLADCTLEQYAQIIMNTNETDYELKKDGDMYYFEYTSIFDGDVYHYTYYIFKSGDAFWMVGFMVFEDEIDRYDDKIKDYAASVTFSK